LHWRARRRFPEPKSLVGLALTAESTDHAGNNPP
jgi:hypothetical protein